MKLGARVAFACFVAIVTVWYLSKHGEDFLLLRGLNLRYLPVMLAVPLASIWVNGQILRILVRQLGIDLTFAEWFGLTALNAFGNYLPIPQAGTIARGIYLKKSHGLDYASFTAAILVTYVEFLACLGLAGLALGASMTLSQQSFPPPFWMLFSGLAATALAFLPLRWPLPVARALQTFGSALATIRRRGVLLRVAGYQLLLISLNIVGIWLAFASFARPVSASGSALLSLVAMTSGVINITPGNVGVVESVAWITAQMTGGNPNEAVVAFTLFRIMALLVVLPLTPLFMSRLSVEFGSRKTDELS